MTQRIKRSQFATYLNTTPASTATWSLLGDGVTNAKESMNPKTSSETYITDNTATISVDSYAPTMPVTATAKVGDPIFEYIRTLRNTRAILGDCETQIINVAMYEAAVSGTTYKATMHYCAISVDEFGGEGGVKMTQNFTLNFQGAPVQGTFDIVAKTWTATTGGE